MAALRPDDWLAQIAACVVAGLIARPTGWTGTVVKGIEAAGESQPCCPSGLLRVEFVGTDPVGDLPAQRCRTRARIDVQVMIRRCVSAFDTGVGGTQGNAPKVAVVEAESLQHIDDAWTIWSSLACCVDGTWKDNHVTLEGQTFSPVSSQCRGSDTRLTIPLAVCCP